MSSTARRRSSRRSRFLESHLKFFVFLLSESKAVPPVGSAGDSELSSNHYNLIIIMAAIVAATFGIHGPSCAISKITMFVRAVMFVCGPKKSTETHSKLEWFSKIPNFHFRISISNSPTKRRIPLFGKTTPKEEHTSGTSPAG